ncbi:ABC transporter substrate-binding protein [Stutzerimonas stutzeri]|uniref:ABC transporter substrate-binding protein n=1 Tax=Stutzerimonas sp. S1 TaxID=3030652 RepID=UPI00222521BB|nr:ABC transporter substrate-binding protein [Stutzerimonas sp. S1]MCW3147239.1 ABC transporter substrate-binding protein [Stutzerimonas sp. S1]
MRRALLLLFGLALLGCQPESDEIRIGSNRWPGYAPLYLADDLRWTEPSRVRLVEYPTTTGVLRGFRNGLLDAAMLTLDEVLLLQSGSEELDLEILLVTDVSAGADVLFARAPIASLAELKGRRIGVESTALGGFFLSRLLDEAQLRLEDVTIVSLPVHEHVEAFRDRRVDAVISFASQGPTLESHGARHLFDSRQLPGEIIDVLVVDRHRVSARQRQLLKALWFDSLRAWQENRAKTDPRLQRRLGLDANALQITLNGLVMGDAALNQQWLVDGQLLRSAQRLSDYLTERQLITKPPAPQQLIAVCRGETC